MRLKRTLLLLLLLPGILRAQKLMEESLQEKSAYTIQYWKTEDGLPQNSVLSVTQAANGNIWLLTYSGISSYDGRQFTNYNEANVSQFKGLQLKSVDRNSKGVPLIYTSKGTLAFDQLQKQFVSQPLGSESVVAEAKGDQGITWQAGDKGSVFRKDAVGNLKLIASLGTGINAMVYKENTLFLATDKGLFVYRKNQLKRVPLGADLDNECSFLIRQSIYPGIKKSSTRRVGGIVSANSDLLCTYLSCDNKHLYYINWRSLEITTSVIDVDQGNIQDLIYDKVNDQIWIAGDVGVYYNKSGISGKFNRIPYINDECYSLEFDLENNLWLGSKSGLFMLKRKLFHTYTRADGLVPDGIAATLEVKPGELLIGNSDCGGLYTMINGKIAKHSEPQLQKMCVWSMYRDSRQDIYVGGGYGSLYRLRGKTCTSIKLPAECRNASVLSMYEDVKGNLWLGTEAGLFIKDATDQVSRFKGFTVKGMVLQLFPDSKGRLWLGTSNQLAVMEQGVWKDLSNASGLKVNYIRSFYEDKEGNIWIGSRGEGLMRYAEGSFDHFPELNKMLSPDVWSITEDRAGFLWMSSNQGITIVKREDLIDLGEGRSAFVTVKHFDRTDGMFSTEFNGGFMPAVLKASDGRLWFPGAKGLTVVDPSKVDFTPFSIPISIEKIIVDGKEVEPDKDNIYHTSLDPQQIQIIYSSPVFGHKQEVVFQSGLDGYDNNWNNPTQERSMIYNNLEAGTYTFRVKLYGNFNKEINKEASIVIEVPAPLWKDPLFIVLVSIVILTIAIGLAIWRVRNIRLKTEEQQHMQKQFAALELKALQSQMNPHFIFNCLNSIKYFISIHDEASAGKYLQSFSRLLRRFLEHSNSSLISLDEEIELLTLYMELQQMRFTHHFKYEFKLSDIKDLRTLQLPTMLLQPFVENAIIHGLLPMDEPGTLTLSFKLQDDLLECLIIDNGIGRLLSGKKRKTTDRSMGTSITGDRIDLLNYFNGYQISSETFDTFTDGRIHTGTTVRLLIPVNQRSNA